MLWIGRGDSTRGLPDSIWRNPFRIGTHGDRTTVLNKYAAHALPQVTGQLDELTGRTLVCACRPHEQCHGDILIQAWQQLYHDKQNQPPRPERSVPEGRGIIPVQAERST